MTFVMTYEKRNRENIAKLADHTRVAAEKWYEYLLANEVDVLIYETIRTKETQAKYVAQGASRTMTSYHIVGQALDFVPVGDLGVTLWSGYGNKKVVAAVQAAKALGFTWGGDWASFVDKPHLQYDKIGYGKDTFGQYEKMTAAKPEPVVVAPTPIAPVTPVAPAPPVVKEETKETGKGVMVSDGWVHTQDTAVFAVKTRLKVIGKGQTVQIYGETPTCYKVGKDMFVSKKLVVKTVQPVAKTGVVVSDVWLHTKADFTVATRSHVAKRGGTLGVYGESNGMYKVRHRGKTLFVSKKYLTIK